MFKLGAAGILLGIAGGFLIVVIGTGHAEINPLTVSNLVRGLTWILPPIFFVDAGIGYWCSKPLFQLERVLRRGEVPSEEIARSAWRAAFRMPYYSSIGSGLCWVAGLGGMAWWMITYSEFTFFEAATMATVGLVVGPITSIDFFFVARRLVAPSIQTAARYLDKPVPPQYWGLWTKITFGLTYLLVGAQAITMVIGYFQTRSLLEDQIESQMTRDLVEFERYLEEGHDVSDFMDRYGSNDGEIQYYRALQTGKLEPEERDGEADKMLERWSHIQARDLSPRHDDKLYPLWEKLFPWSEDTTLKWRGRIMLTRSSEHGRLLGVANIDRILWNWGVVDGVWLRNGFYLLLGLLLAGGLAILMTLDITRPVARLREAASRVERGERGYLVGSTSDDEIGELSRAFDGMSRSVLDQLNRMEELLAKVSDAAQRLGITSGELKKIAQDQMAGATEQAAAIQQALTTSEEISATARQISETAGGVEKAADQTTGACNSGMEDVSNAHQGMEGIRQQMQGIADHMVELGEHSDQIGIILDIIRDISEETNLLSLNAAIEAAGAGEAGERFSVVAAEVRSLAERTQQSTGRIQALTDQLRNSIGKAVMAAEVGEKAVSTGYDRMQAAKSSFENITQYAEGTARASKEISISSNQQTSASDELTGAISEVHEVSRTFLSSTQQMEKSIQELGELADAMQVLMTEQEGKG